MKKKRFLRTILLLFTIFSMFTFQVGTVCAEAVPDSEYVPEETEPETIEAYTLPIESNNTKDWPEGPKIEAEAAIVMEVETGTVLYAKNIKAKEYPASITKLMTVLVALENGNLDDTVTFSQEAVYSIEPGSSHLGIRPEEQLSLRQSLFGIMLASANDISNGVAEHIGGSIDHFVEMMNQKAADLGCINTHFMNAHGLHDDNHYVCAYDMGLIAREVYKYPSFRTITQTVECSFPPTNVVDESRYFINHQKMLYDEEFKYEGCVGGKTGFTDQALNTLVTYAERDGMTLVSVILKLNGSYKTFQESALLLDYGFNNFEKKTFSNQTTDTTFDSIIKTNPAENIDIASSLDSEALQMDDTSTVIVPKGINMSDLKPTVTKNDDNTGVLDYRYNGWPVGTVNLTFQEVAAAPETEKMSETMPETIQTEAEKTEDSRSVFHMLERGVSKMGELIQKADEYILTHKVLCIVICVILLIIFVPTLILTYFRARKLSKRRKDIEWEREEIERIEREINEKSTEEIEMELRAAMKREKDAQKKAEEAMEEFEKAKQHVNKIVQKKSEAENQSNKTVEKEHSDIDETAEERSAEERPQDHEEEEK